MQEHEQGDFGQFAAIMVKGQNAPNPLRKPGLRVIMGRAFVRGTYAWPTEYWLNGSVALIPLDEVVGIFTFSSEQEYGLAVEKHRAARKAKEEVSPNAEGASGSDVG